MAELKVSTIWGVTSGAGSAGRGRGLKCGRQPWLHVPVPPPAPPPPHALIITSRPGLKEGGRSSWEQPLSTQREVPPQPPLVVLPVPCPSSDQNSGSSVLTGFFLETVRWQRPQQGQFWEERASWVRPGTVLRGFYLSNSLKWTTSSLPALSSPPTLHCAFHTVAPGAFFWELTNTKPGLRTMLLSLPRAPSSSCSPNSLSPLPFSSRPQFCR